MASKFNVERVKQWLPKKHLDKIELVDEDSEVIEVVLKPGLSNATHLETVWVFGKFRYESGSYTLKQIQTDLTDWLNNVKPDHELA